MRKRFMMILAIALLSLASLHTAGAESLVGEWRGSANVSALSFSLSATVKFEEDGTFSLNLTSLFGISGLNAKGFYAVSDSSISITPTNLGGLFAAQLASVERIGTVSLPYGLQDGKLTIAGSGMGMDGSISLTRR